MPSGLGRIETSIGARMNTPAPGSQGEAVSLVFTDIEGSTQLWEDLGEDFLIDLETHNQTLRDAISKHNGYEVKTEGDAFMVAFNSALDALEFCMTTQQTLQNGRWSPSLLNLDPPDQTLKIRGPRVRMGIHTGQPQLQENPLSRRMDYFGPMVNRAARLAHAAHGGQVVLSDNSFADIGAQISEATVTDLGIHKLRGLLQPEHIRQIMPATLHHRSFPPLRTPRSQPSSLPIPGDDFIGRKEELETLKTEVLGPHTRLVTLLGSGGSGKTRLALEWARRNTKEFEGGCWFFDLKEARNRNQILHIIASAMEISLTRVDAAEAVQLRLSRQGHALFILDNVEQIREPMALLLQDWLKTGLTGRFLVTSRIRLGLNAEQTFPIGSLQPDDALNLFIERARNGLAEINIHTENMEQIRSIVQRLEALPLAVELAASRMRLMSAAQINQRMIEMDSAALTPSVSFDGLLDTEAIGTQRGERTLRSTVLWSWQLLEPWEQAALAQCSLFRGGFDLDSAEAIISLESWPDAPPVMSVIQALMDHSLLRSERPRPGCRRLTMLRSIAAFATEKLAESDQLEATQRRHACFFASLGTRIYQRSLLSEGGTQKRRRLHTELDNLVLATHNALKLGALDTAMACGLAAAKVYQIQGPPKDGMDLLEQCLKGGESSSILLARTIHQNAYLKWMTGNAKDAISLTERSLQMSIEEEDDYLQAMNLDQLGLLYINQGEIDKAMDAYKKGEALCTRPELDTMRSTILMHRSKLHQSRLEVALAKELIEKALSIQHRQGNRWNEGIARNHLGTLHRMRGEYDTSRKNFLEAARILEEVEHVHYQSVILSNLGALENEVGNLDESQRCYEMALEIMHSSNSPWNRVQILNNLALLAMQRLNWTQAREYLEEGLEIDPDRAGLATNCILKGNLAETLLYLGEFDSAATLLEDAITTIRPLNPAAAGAFMGTSGLLHARRGKFEQAHTLFSEGAALLVNQMPLELAKLYCKQASALEIQSRNSEAEALLSRIRTMADELNLQSGSIVRTAVRRLEVRMSPALASAPTIID